MAMRATPTQMAASARLNAGQRLSPRNANDTSTKSDPKVIAGYDDGRAFRRSQPSGSGAGPMRDLVRVAEMILGNGELDGIRVLSPQTVEAMIARHRTGYVDETFGMVIDWGLGLIVNSFHYRNRPTSYGYGKHASRRTEKEPREPRRRRTRKVLIGTLAATSQVRAP